MATNDTINVGDPYVAGVRAWRWTTSEPARRVPLDLTTCTLVTTLPAGTTVTTLIGSLRHPETGRYELDGTATTEGTYKFDWTMIGSFTDEDGLLRTYTNHKHKEIKVAPLSD